MSVEIRSVPLRFKGMLGDGHLHMTAHQFTQHRLAEYHEKDKLALRKLANNPILTNECRDLLSRAVYTIDCVEFYRKLCEKLREELDEQRRKV